MQFKNRARFWFVNLFVRPLIRAEMPGWGRLFHFFVGDYKSGARWEGVPPVWVRGKLHGYDMRIAFDSWSNRQTWCLGRFYDLPTQIAVGALLGEGDAFADIGANEGMIALLAARCVGASGQVIAFEPNPVPRAKFEASVTRNAIGNIRIVAAGASDQPGELKMFVPAINTGEGSFATQGMDSQPGEEISCPVVTADSQLEGANPRLIKIDVEDFEGFVLKGLSGTLVSSRPAILMEMVDTHLNRSAMPRAAILALMAGYKYRGFRLSLAGGRIKSLALSPIDPENWTDGDMAWLPEEQAEALAARLRGATISAIA